MVSVLRLDELKNMPDNWVGYQIGDVHLGSLSCDYGKFQKVLDEIRKKKNAFMIGMGDYIEGQDVTHPHFDYETIGGPAGYDLWTPSGQVDLSKDMLEPLANKGKILGLIKGNHDWRYDNVKPFLRDMCVKDLEVPYLGARSTIFSNDGGVRIYLAHKGRMLSNSAGSERQLRTNIEESLVRQFTRPRDKWGSAHLMSHGHTHQLVAVKPYHGDGTRATLMSRRDGGDHGMAVIPNHGTTNIKGYEYVDPDDRFYSVTGTFRRSGVMQDISHNLGADLFDDYADKGDFPPGPIGYTKFIVKNSQIVDIEEVVMESHPEDVIPR